MVIVIGCDHAACKFKEVIISHMGGVLLPYAENFDPKSIPVQDKSAKIIDCGCYPEIDEVMGVAVVKSVDYPDIAEKVCKLVLKLGSRSKGILLCGTGIGMSIAANKFNGIRAAVCSETFSAKHSRLHNDANVLCMGARCIDESAAFGIIANFLNTDFEGDRHIARLEKIVKIEEDN
jgi:ribose 5-phosphate isomerase B